MTDAVITATRQEVREELAKTKTKTAGIRTNSYQKQGSGHRLLVAEWCGLVPHDAASSGNLVIDQNSAVRVWVFHT